MKYVVLMVLAAIVACSNSVEPRTDTNRPCYDECDRNADCAEGLACSEGTGHVCVPEKCVGCWATNGGGCVIDETYVEDRLVCEFNHCEG